jgi:hypothetical protein
MMHFHTVLRRGAPIPQCQNLAVKQTQMLLCLTPQAYPTSCTLGQSFWMTQADMQHLASALKMTTGWRVARGGAHEVLTI